jgi:hypothetical protein
MSERRSGRIPRRAAALVLAVGGAAGVLTAVQGAAQGATLPRCPSSHDIVFAANSPARIVAEGELSCDGGLFVKIFRNGTVVWSGGNGTGIVTAVYNCRGTAVGDFQAVWSNGASDAITASCG